MKIETLKEELKCVTDPRRTSYGNVRHKLEDIITIGLCTIVCGGEDFVDMEGFGKERELWLRNFLELPNGIQDSDTFRRLFERIIPSELSKCLTNWLKFERIERAVIAVDEKTIRGNEKHKAYHVVSAFVAENQVVLGKMAVAEKTNEITAKKADYVIGLKGNQSSLHEDVALYFREDAARARKDNSPFNMNLLCKFALSLLSAVKFGRIGNRKKMFKAALNPAVLAQILFGKK